MHPLALLKPEASVGTKPARDAELPGDRRLAEGVTDPIWERSGAPFPISSHLAGWGFSLVLSQVLKEAL